jgi:hypothetical protein
LKKLLCFGERVWERLRGVVEKEGWGWVEVGGGEVRRPAVSWIDQLDSAPEDTESLEEDHRCLEISYRRLNWWETEHWSEICDERGLWGDLSRQDQKKLDKLKGR